MNRAYDGELLPAVAIEPAAIPEERQRSPDVWNGIDGKVIKREPGELIALLRFKITNFTRPLLGHNEEVDALIVAHAMHHTRNPNHVGIQIHTRFLAGFTDNRLNNFLTTIEMPGNSAIVSVFVASVIPPQKQAKKRKSKVTLVEGDAMAMPFKDGVASAATISFGMRNLPDYAAGVREMARIVRPGGRVICLEATPYDHPVLKYPFNFYFHRVLPVIGKLLTGQYEAYKYLPESVAHFPKPDELAEIFREAGLVDVQVTMLGFGSVALHVGTDPLEK